MPVRPIPPRVARLGEYFAPADASGGGWHPLHRLYDTDTLAGLTVAIRSAMARSAATDPTAVPARVAASSLHLSVAAQVLSPAVGGFAAVSAVPLLTADTVRWRTAGHSIHIGVTALDWVDTADSALAAATLDRSVLSEVLLPLGDALAESSGLSRNVTRGNVMSAANGAVTVMDMRGNALSPAGRELVAALARLPLLHGAATVAGSTLRRHNCCLYYLAPGGGLCQDCVLRPATGQ